MKLNQLVFLLINAMDYLGGDIEVGVAEDRDPKLKLITREITGIKGPGQMADDRAVIDLVLAPYPNEQQMHESNGLFEKPKAFTDEELVVKAVRILTAGMGEDALRLHQFLDGAPHALDTLYDVWGSELIKKYPHVFARDLQVPKSEYADRPESKYDFDDLGDRLRTAYKDDPEVLIADTRTLEAHGGSIPHDDSDVPLPNGRIVKRAPDNTDED